MLELISPLGGKSPLSESKVSTAVPTGRGQHIMDVRLAVL